MNHSSLGKNIVYCLYFLKVTVNLSVEFLPLKQYSPLVFKGAVRFNPQWVHFHGILSCLCFEKYLILIPFTNTSTPRAIFCFPKHTLPPATDGDANPPKWVTHSVKNSSTYWLSRLKPIFSFAVRFLFIWSFEALSSCYFTNSFFVKTCFNVTPSHTPCWKNALLWKSLCPKCVAWQLCVLRLAFQGADTFPKWLN